VDRFALHRGLIDQLRQDPALHTESEKIWDSCTSGEQETLRLLFSGLETDPSCLSQLMKRHILVQMKEERRAFCRLFAEYVLAHQTDTAGGEGIDLDDESGEVSVNGRQIDLTALEYQLLKLLFQNSNRIVDKYQIVQDVWGDDGLREVDDARIEKLISRLRQKVEPDPSNPVYIVTARGRGYRLVSA
jgi:DNA-binding response OmpR family regulator